jgi:hypothetical protein
VQRYILCPHKGKGLEEGIGLLFKYGRRLVALGIGFGPNTLKFSNIAPEIPAEIPFAVD